jgi:hypothetical protein
MGAPAKPKAKLAPAVHPSGVGCWLLTHREDPSIRARSNGHTAFEAFLAARRFLPNQYSFCDFEFRLVGDKPGTIVGRIGGRA